MQVFLAEFAKKLQNILLYGYTFIVYFNMLL